MAVTESVFELRYNSPRGIPKGYAPKLVSQKIKSIALAIVKQHKKDINTKYPPASQPGTFPARRTGNLRKSVSMNPTSITAEAIKKLTTLKVKLGYDESNFPKYPYWKALFYGTRKIEKRAMLSITAARIIQVQLAASNPVPWTSTAEWRPLTFSRRSGGMNA